MDTINTFLRVIGKGVYYVLTLASLLLSICTLYVCFPPAGTFAYLTVLAENVSHYGNVFTITIALVSVYYILHQIELSLKLKWQENLENFLSNSKFEVLMLKGIVSYFDIHSDEMFDFLYSRSNRMKIADKKELEDYFNRYIKEKIPEFEEFPSTEPQASFETVAATVNTIVIFILKPTPEYKALEKDFVGLYCSTSKHVKEIK